MGGRLFKLNGRPTTYRIDAQNLMSDSTTAAGERLIPKQEPIEAFLFLFEDARERLRARFSVTTDNHESAWGLTDGSIIELQVVPGEPLRDQVESVLGMREPPEGADPYYVTHYTLVGPLGSSERESVAELCRICDNVVWYVTPEVYANRESHFEEGSPGKKVIFRALR